MLNKKFQTSLLHHNDIDKDRPLRFIEELRSLGFTEEEERKLRESLAWHIYKKGHTINGRNEIMQNRFYVIRGAARSYYIEKGKEFNYSFSFAGQFILLPFSVMENNREVYVQFLEETEVCYIPTKQDKNNYPSLDSAKFMMALNMAYKHHIAELEEKLFMLRRDAKDRYQWIIERHPHILEVVSITQLASFLNVTKETLYRIRSGKY